MIDYEDLLRRYLAHVAAWEGTNYVEMMSTEGDGISPATFTAEEIAAVRRLDS
jgi:hypothetical protein